MNPYFQFKRFTVYQDACAMKVSTDACAFGAWAGKRVPASSKQILDIGTGTGLLSLMLAQATEEQETNITALEIDPAAAKQAAKNVADSPWPNRIQVIRGDIREFSAEEKFDGIICNPPFFKNDLKPLASHYRRAHHEDSLTSEQLFHRADQLIASNGWMALLIPPHRLDDYAGLANQHNWQIIENTTLAHSSNHAPLRQLLWLGKHPETPPATKENKLYVHQQPQQFHEDFFDLLRPFYLNL